MGWLQPAHLVPNLLTTQHSRTRQAIAKRLLHTHRLAGKYTYTHVYLHPHTMRRGEERRERRERGERERERERERYEKTSIKK